MSSQQGTETTKRAQTSNIFTGDLSWIGHASPPVEKIDDVIEDMLKPEIDILLPRLELEIVAPLPTVSLPISDSDESMGKPLFTHMLDADESIWELLFSHMSYEESIRESPGVPLKHHSDESIWKPDADESIWELLFYHMSYEESIRE